MILMCNVMVVVFLYNCVTANIAYVKRTDLKLDKTYSESYSIEVDKTVF